MTAEPAEQIPKPFGKPSDKKSVKINTKLRDRETKELVVGLCGPVGTPIHLVSKALSEKLINAHGIRTKILKLSSYIEDIARTAGRAIPSDDQKFNRVKKLIDEGNTLRHDFGNGVLAELAIADIHEDRCNARRDLDTKIFKADKCCHIIDSLKNTEELGLLKQVYGPLFFCIGVYTDRRDREKHLTDSFSMTNAQIYELIDQDSGEEAEYGQRVEKLFHQSDYFLHIDSDNSTAVNAEIDRICDLILGTRIVTPRPEEAAMYAAFSAGLNSACLSRQVGAAVTDCECNILSNGWNDVPSFGGGLYSEGRTPDNRCLNMGGGKCFNDEEKSRIMRQIAQILTEKEFIDAAKSAEVIAALRDSRIASLIEFSRAVHAEMHAIINAGIQGRGKSMIGGKIFITTFPCHACARHIVASGIAEVYFVEPYPKSLATKLHGDSLSSDPKSRDKVRLLPFRGVGPCKYRELFELSDKPRKKDGMMIISYAIEREFKAKISLESLPNIEAMIVKDLQTKRLIPESE